MAHDASAVRSRFAVWRDIRALRHRAPGRADRGDRRRVFSSALEQAEQLFGAAEAAGYASRPILLFYGLSQAGRAIAAASTAADNDSYRLVGHGIEVPNLSQRTPLHALLLTDKGKGSFTQLAELLKSSSLPQATTFGQIWAVLPELISRPIDTSGTEYKAVLAVDNAQGGSYFDRSLKPEGDGVVARVSGLPPRLGERQPNSTEAREACAEYLSFYPTLRETMNPTSHHTVKLVRVMVRENQVLNSGAGAIWCGWEQWVPAGVVETVTQPYRAEHDRWIFPAPAGGSRPLHPLLTWWALLYALSMLARYEPASWTAHLNVDASPTSVALEEALSYALDTCPALILRAIRTVSA